MAGTYRTLRRGSYRLEVKPGAGPAGVRREAGEDVAVDVRGGREVFRVERPERVYYWWRGRSQRDGVALVAERSQLEAAPRAPARQARRRAPAATAARVSSDSQVA